MEKKRNSTPQQIGPAKKSVPLLSWPAPSVTPKKRATFSPQTL